MRVMSFAHTAPQMRARSKTVTRRMGWGDLKPGDRLLAVVKARGVSVEEREDLGTIEVVDVRREPLWRVEDDDVDREGFPGMGREAFIDLFKRLAGLRSSHRLVTRIEFRHVEE